ncbi:DUF998 domain-containing protein [Planosporangium sp. 12N6]|uniref:DUF998 domain-containing protein n=1 Tax=Planosporangium spinosum TaxID=3402278 RepID=UPI003CE6BF92
MRTGRESRPAVERMAAGSAALLMVAGAAGLAVATGGYARVAGYVSESGVTGAPRAGLYRWSVICVGCAVALLAVVLRGSSRPAATLLAGAAPCAIVSSVVRCTRGCPLPPYEAPTAADLVHAGASIAGLLLLGGAMLVLARPGVDGPVRRVGRGGLTVAVPLLAAAGMSMAVAGRGAATGVLERVALAAALGWLVAVAVARALPRRRLTAGTST